MLRKNFPGRKKLRQKSATARQAQPLTNAEQMTNWLTVCERAKAFDIWYANLHRAKKQHTPSPR